MDRNQEVLSLINNVKDHFTTLVDRQHEINHNIEVTLNRCRESTVMVVCKDYLDRLNTIDRKQLKLDQLLKKKQVEVASNGDIVKILEDAEKTLIKLNEFCRSKRERNLEKAMITDIMICYWNAVGIKLQFGSERANTILLFTNHDETNEELKNCKIYLNISDQQFDIVDVEPSARLEEMKQIESDVKANGKRLKILIFKLYLKFIDN